jgi:hypothetical protein
LDIETVMKNSNNSDISLRADGSAVLVTSFENRGVRELSISSEGLLGINFDAGSNGDSRKAMLSGDSIFVSRFKESVPVGTSILQRGQSTHILNHQDRVRVADTRLDSESFSERISVLVEQEGFHEISDILFHSNEGYDAVSWENLIPRRFQLEQIEIRDEIEFGKRGSQVGFIGETRVLLSPLPDVPAQGKIEIAKNIRVNKAEVWARRFHLMISVAEYPPDILRPVGAYKLDSSFYIVSLFPDEISMDTISLNSTESEFDDALIQLEQIGSMVQFMHGHGITFNGSLNPNAFIWCENSKVYLNTAYVLSHVEDAHHLYGKLCPDEFRFLSPWRVAQLSIPWKNVLGVLDLRTHGSLSAVQDDIYSLGLLVIGMERPSGFAFGWLSHSQFLVCSLAKATLPECPVPWMTAECAEPVVLSSQTPQMRRDEDLSSFEKLGYRLMKGSMNLSDFLSSLRRYAEWCEEIVNDTSVETEVKSMLTKLSAVIQESSGIIRTSLRNV